MVSCVFLAVVEVQIVVKCPFHLTDDAEVFDAKVHAIKETITNVHRQGLSELDIYSDSRSALQALYRPYVSP